MKLDGWWIAAGVVLVAGGLVFYNQRTAGDDGALSKQPDRVKQCRSLKGSPEQRLSACLAELSVPPLSQAAATELRELAKDQPLYTIGAKLQGQGYAVLSLDDTVRAAALGSDERAMASAIRNTGARGLVVHRDLTQALDRDKVVLSRLVHHDFLEWFQLRYVTEELLVYTVRNSPTRIPVSTGDAMLKGLRARLEGRTPVRQSWAPPMIRLIGVLRLQGNALVVRHEVGPNLDAVLDSLAAKMARRWEREVAPEGHGALVDRLDDVRIEVHVVMERASIEPRSRYAIFDLWEMGVDGMMFRQREGVKEEKFTYLPGSEAAVRSQRSADAFLQYAVQKGGWRDRRPWQDTRTRLDLIRTQHFMESERGGGVAVRLFRGFPEVSAEEVTDRSVQQMLIDGAEWWSYNLRGDNSFEYKYWPTQNRRSTEYNEVRHILAARDLANAWRYRQDDRYLKASVRAMDWLDRYTVYDTDTVDPRMPHPGPGSMLFRYPKWGELGNKLPNQKLGTVAVALLGWIAWAEATESHDRDEQIRKMGNYVLSQIEPGGKFKAYNVPSTHPYYTEKNDIVPGEAALALGRVAEYFDERSWLRFFPKYIEYYKPWFESRAVQTNPYGRWPHDTYANQTRLDLVQFGPWSVMAAKQYYRMTGDEQAAEFGLTVADWMIDYYQWTEDRAPFPDYTGGYYKLPEELPAMQTFCYSEGTAAAYTIAALYKPDVRQKYKSSTEQSIRFMRLMQYDALDSYFTADPDKVFGGIKYAINENKIRIDYVGHGLSTLSQYLDAKEMDPLESLIVDDPVVLGLKPVEHAIHLPPESAALQR